MGLIGGAALGAVGSLGAAAIGSGAAGKSADAQVQAANTAAQTQLQMYNTTRSDLSPYMSYGTNALTQLANIFGFGGGATAGPAGGQPNPALATQLLTQFPGYQFGLSQGVEALDRSAASKGLVLSGGQLKDLTTFGQNYGMANAWQPFISQLTGAANLGENAAAGVGNIGASTGAGVAQSQLAAGDARAQGASQSANIWGSALGGITNSLSPLFTSSYGGPTIGGQTGQDFAYNLNFNNYNPAVGIDFNPSVIR